MDVISPVQSNYPWRQSGVVAVYLGGKTSWKGMFWDWSEGLKE